MPSESEPYPHCRRLEQLEVVFQIRSPHTRRSKVWSARPILAASLSVPAEAKLLSPPSSHVLAEYRTLISSDPTHMHCSLWPGAERPSGLERVPVCFISTATSLRCADYYRLHL
eukprot:4677701-Pyramimonas_sp.AAC.3